MQQSEKDTTTNHIYLTNKRDNYFKGLLEPQNRVKLFLKKKKKPVTFSEKAQNLSYLAELTAKSKGNTIAKNPIMPACNIQASKMLGYMQYQNLKTLHYLYNKSMY